MKAFEAETEIFEFAISKEVQANRLYTVLMNKIEDPTLKSVFAGFADEELEHKAKLELELMKLGIVVSQDNEPLTDNYEQQVQMSQDVDLADIFKICMQKERESFRLYIDLSWTVRQPNAREMLLQLAEEEAKHMARFQFELDALAGPGQ